ncbi:EPIDERMAL PATTERNING FACTOR-like protein 4-like [Dorcoceras hygrometricum]|uniref:Epidermal patterning factor-like protein n=1 Tax=Dorcoceras hygrometricum TaxID=472368 RepID=A0A2Z6ZVG1_9LAMI|nr:EPIDERMAL PATTERNING FACTOR-like protein 4-like [Dorcoceras hygrometricum]
MAERRPYHRRDMVFLATLITLAFIILTSVSALGFYPNLYLTSVGGRKKIREETTEGTTRRKLGGLGSSPPTCRSKCGWCTPCKPVHVPVHPGLFTPLEYYPEAWRCNCGNKLFMP